MGDIVAYHGDTGNKSRSNYHYKYFTAHLGYARRFAEEKGRIEKVKIHIKKPFVIEATYLGYGEIILNNKIIGFYRDLQPDAVLQLKKAGYDGIIANHGAIKSLEIIPFSESQVKMIDKNFEKKSVCLKRVASYLINAASQLDQAIWKSGITL